MMRLRVKTLIFTAVICLFMSTVSIANSDVETSDQASVEESVWVWADSSDNKDQIYLTRGSDSSWSTPEALSENTMINVVPAVIKLNDGNVFVIWSAYDNGQSKLLYRYEIEDAWSEELVFPSDMTQNTAPSAAVDEEGTVWIVWAGFDGVSDQIFYSTWDGQEFSTPTAISNNETPDILPVVGLNDETGTLWVEWSQYSTDGYFKVQSSYNDNEWAAAVPVDEDVDDQDTDTEVDSSDEVSDSDEIEITIPEVVTDIKSASVHIPGNEIQSLPVRNMNIVEE